MVSTPALHVVLKHLLRNGSGGAGPGGAVTHVEADDQVGCFADVRTLVVFSGIINLTNGAGFPLFVLKLSQLRDDFLLEGPLFLTRRNNAFGLSPCQIEIHPSQSYRIGPCLAPIHILKPFRTRGLVLHSQISILIQPCVEIDSPFKGLEPVIGHDDQHRFIVDIVQDTTHQIIHVLVQILNLTTMFLYVFPCVGRMILLKVSPKHMLKPVGDVKDTDDRTPPGLFDRIKEHSFPFFVNQIGLL